MAERTLQTNLSISNLFRARDEAFHAALLALGRAYRDGRLSDDKYWTLNERLHAQFERKQTGPEMIMFVYEWQRIVKDFER